MDRTLKEHEQMIDKHEVKLEDIQQNLIDIKTRLGIKDLTNGQVVEYQKQLVHALDEEKAERKAQDERLEDRLWYISTGIVVSILIGIVGLLFKGG